MKIQAIGDFYIASRADGDTILRDDPEAAIVRITKFGKLFESTIYTSGTIADNFAIGIAVSPAIREKMCDVEVTRYTTAEELASSIVAEGVCLISEGAQ